MSDVQERPQAAAPVGTSSPVVQVAPPPCNVSQPLPTAAGEDRAFSENSRKGPCQVRLQGSRKSPCDPEPQEDECCSGCRTPFSWVLSVVLISELQWDWCGGLVAGSRGCVCGLVGRVLESCSPSRLAKTSALNSQYSFCLSLWYQIPLSIIHGHTLLFGG